MANGVISFVGTDPSALSTVTSSIKGEGPTSTQARIGLHTGIVDGKDEFSLFISPGLAEEISAILSASSKSAMQTRGLQTREPAILLVLTLTNLFGSNLALSLAPVLSSGVLDGGLFALVPLTVSVSAVAIPLLALAAWAVNIYAEFLSFDGTLPVAIKVPLSEFRDANTCPSPPVACESCAGQDLLCKSGKLKGCKLCSVITYVSIPYVLELNQAPVSEPHSVLTTLKMRIKSHFAGIPSVPEIFKLTYAPKNLWRAARV